MDAAERDLAEKVALITSPGFLEVQDVTFIATHGGQLSISGLLLANAGRMLRANPNVLMETFGIYREDFIEDTVQELGAERVIFGSNAPYMDQGFETLRVRLAHL